MLFLQGTRDALAEMTLMASVIESLGPRATLKRLDGADHSFKVPAKTGLSAAAVLADLLDAVATWARRIAAGTPGSA